jgi:hypothetical protein
MDEARTAIETLGRNGIEGQRVSLRGPAAEHATHEPERAPENYQADAAVFRRWVPVVVGGAITGAVIGAIVGLPVGLAVVSLFTDLGVSVESALISAFIGAMFGAFVGGLIAAMTPTLDTQAWELSFHETGGEDAVVGVHSSDAAEVARARDVFERLGALEVREVGPEARPRPAVRAMAGRR